MNSSDETSYTSCIYKISGKKSSTSIVNYNSLYILSRRLNKPYVFIIMVMKAKQDQKHYIDDNVHYEHDHWTYNKRIYIATSHKCEEVFYDVNGRFPESLFTQRSRIFLRQYLFIPQIYSILSSDHRSFQALDINHNNINKSETSRRSQEKKT